MRTNLSQIPATKSGTAFFILTLCSTIVLLVLTDIGLQRFLKVPSRYLKKVIQFDSRLSPAKRMLPNLDITLVGAFNEFKFRVTTNNEGFRRSTPYEINDKIQPSMILLGDSQTFGVGVDDDQTIASHLSRISGKPVLNTGCSGYNNIEEFLLTKTLLKKYKPDYFILLFFPGNDPYENFTNRSLLYSSTQTSENEPLKKKKGSIAPIAGLKSYLVRHSALYYLSTFLRRIGPVNELLFRAKLVNQSMPNEILIYSNASTKKNEFWKITDEVLLELRETIEISGSKLLITMIPDKFQVNPSYWKQWREKYKIQATDFNRFAPNEHLKKFCETNHIEFLDLTPIFQLRNLEGLKLYWRLDHHLREQGNQIIAESLHDYLKK